MDVQNQYLHYFKSCFLINLSFLLQNSVHEDQCPPSKYCVVTPLSSQVPLQNLLLEQPRRGRPFSVTSLRKRNTRGEAGRRWAGVDHIYLISTSLLFIGNLNSKR